MDGRADWGETCAMRGLKISQHMQLEEFLGHSYKKPPETTGAVMNSSQITEVCSLRSDVCSFAQVYLNVYSDVLFLLRCVLIFTQVCYFCSDVFGSGTPMAIRERGFSLTAAWKDR